MHNPDETIRTIANDRSICKVCYRCQCSADCVTARDDFVGWEVKLLDRGGIISNNEHDTDTDTENLFQRRWCQVRSRQEGEKQTYFVCLSAD